MWSNLKSTDPRQSVKSNFGKNKNKPKKKDFQKKKFELLPLIRNRNKMREDYEDFED